MLNIWITLLFSFELFAHQSSLTNTGKELFWVNPSVPVAVQTNTTDMSSQNALAVIQASMAEWTASSSARVYQTTTSNNQIKFVKNFPYGSAVLGVTEISFNTSGSIQKASILLNDDYLFHPTPGFYPTGQAYLGDVVTHELGHLLGLSHSEVLDSTMFYSSFSGQSSVSFDDRSGVRHKYDTQYGSISGYVKGGNSVGVLGAHVMAISRRTGGSSGVVTDDSGYFELGGLDLDDTYYLYTAPVKNTDSLPGYFANIQNEFCPASYVGSFFTACGRENDGNPQGITLTFNEPSFDVGTVTINCGLKTDPAYDLEKLRPPFTSYSVFDYGKDQRTERAHVGWFQKPKNSDWSGDDRLTVDLTSYFDLGGTAKYLKVALVSYPFGAQLEYEMSVYQDGFLVDTKNISYSMTTQTHNTDLSTYVSLSNTTSANNFEIRVRSKRLPSSYVPKTFPAYATFSTDQHLPYLLMTSLWELTPQGLAPLLDTSARLSDNEACLDAPFTYAVSRTLAPDDGITDSSQKTAAAAASCGTIDPPGGGPGSSLPLLMMGFFFSMLVSMFAKSGKKFLS